MKFDTKMQRMRDRLDAITFVQQPPTLSMKIIGADDPNQNPINGSLWFVSRIKTPKQIY